MRILYYIIYICVKNYSQFLGGEVVAVQSTGDRMQY